MKDSSRNLMIGAMLAVAALGAAFWILLLAPQREEAAKLESKVGRLRSSLSQHRSEASAAEAARRQFPVDYQRLVVLGKAVPADDDTASLIVQVNDIAHEARVKFNNLELSGSGEGAEAPAPATSAGVSPTEAAASLMPLGATIGPAGLGVMPYTLTFYGGFFHVAKFVHGLDSLVESESEKVAVDGRLATIGGFTLEADPEKGFPKLKATFEVTTFITPPGQDLAAGATPLGPAAMTGTPVATTTGGTP